MSWRDGYKECMVRKGEWYVSPKAIINQAKNLSTFNKNKGYVYFLLVNEKIIYVGKTTKLYQRIQTHKKDKFFNKVYYINVRLSIMGEIEKYYIRLIKPRHNKLIPREITGINPIDKYSEHIVKMLKSGMFQSYDEFMKFDKWTSEKYPRRIFKRTAVTEDDVNEYIKKLDALLQQVTPDNLHGEVDTGAVVGNEVW